MNEQRQQNFFPGGLQLNGHKGESTTAPLRELPMPPQLVLPLVQHAGAAAVPVVQAGQRVLGHQEIARADGERSCSLHAPTSATVLGVERRPVPHPGGLMADCLVLEPDGQNEFGQFLQPLDTATLDAETLLRRVREAGIAGLGGAAFPTAAKLAGAAGREQLRLVINGAECEPYITCDDMLMREQADEILLGAQQVMDALGIERALVAVERDKLHALKALEAAIERLADPRFRLERIFTIYPAGGERQLVQVLSGREVPSGGLPIDIGYLCQNVATLVAVHRAVTRGVPLTHRITTVTGGGVVSPANFLCPLGTPVQYLAQAAGGYTADAERLIMGGPMMGIALSTDAVPVVKATNCLLALRRDQVRPAGDALPCIRCGECARACPAGLQPQELYWRIRGNDIAGAGGLNLSACIECGCCDMVCPSHIPLVQHYRYAKSQARLAETQRAASDVARQRFENRKLRLDAEEARRKERLEAKRKRRTGKTAPAGDIKGEINAIVARTRSKREAADPGDEAQ